MSSGVLITLILCATVLGIAGMITYLAVKTYNEMKK